jgi:hypothetical protein
MKYAQHWGERRKRWQTIKRRGAIALLCVGIVLTGLDPTPRLENVKAETIEVFMPDTQPVYEWELRPLSRIETKIVEAAIEAEINPDTALRIAKCESALDPYAVNAISGAKGLYQFTDTTWEFIRAQGHPFDADENIRQFMIWYPIHPEWWMCQ